MWRVACVISIPRRRRSRGTRAAPVAREEAEGYAGMQVDTRYQDGERSARRWTREEYERIVEAGVLGPEDHVELIDGEILVVSPEGPRHASTIDLTRRALERAFPASFFVRPGHPLAADDRSLPEPDLLVVPGDPGDYLDRHPAPADGVLLVEVSNTSLGFDLDRKLRLYARAGLPEYWVIDLVNRCVHVHREPTGDGFRSTARVAPPGMLQPLRAPAAIDLAEILRP